MRSYYAHLEQIKEKQTLNRSKPIFRASAIFPAIHGKGISTRLLFLSYWLLKRGIQEMSCLVTLRSKGGEVLQRKMEMIDQPRAYRVELIDFLGLSGWNATQEFIGSLEIEFFSASPLVYPYPAVTINYYGPNCSTVVHTAQRIFNDHEDMLANTQQQVPESGFNIYADSITEPYVALINGPVGCRETAINYQFINADNQQLCGELLLGALAPYETRAIYPARGIDLRSFLKGKAGTLKLSFDIPWIFPRLVVGNRQEQAEIFSITHSYYDCSHATERSDYWINPEEGWYPAALSVPVQILDDAFTKIYFYPIFTPGEFTLDLCIYDAKGVLVGEKRDILSVEETSGQYLCVSINDMLEGLPKERDLSAHIVAKARKGHPIPARIKISLDIGYPQGLPCNICTNLVPYNPEWAGKKKTFRWIPLLADQPRSSAWILNNSPRIDQGEEALAILSFYRERDTEFIEREAVIPANGFIVIRPEEDPELAAFFQNTIGWMTVAITNPYATTYYFAENPSGTVGGDHGY